MKVFPDWLLNSSYFEVASPEEKLIYVYIRNSWIESSDSPPDLEKIASDLRLCETTVRVKLRKLVNRGWIDSEYRFMDTEANEYIKESPAPKTLTKPVEESVGMNKLELLKATEHRKSLTKKVKKELKGTSTEQKMVRVTGTSVIKYINDKYEEHETGTKIYCDMKSQSKAKHLLKWTGQEFIKEGEELRYKKIIDYSFEHWEEIRSIVKVGSPFPTLSIFSSGAYWQTLEGIAESGISAYRLDSSSDRVDITEEEMKKWS